MRIAAAIFATSISFSAQALESPEAAPTDLPLAPASQLDVGAPAPAPITETAPLPPTVDRSLDAPRPAVPHKARPIVRRPDALAQRSHPPRRVLARAPVLPLPEEALRPVPRRCEVITCPRFVLLGVGF